MRILYVLSTLPVTSTSLQERGSPSSGTIQKMGPLSKQNLLSGPYEDLFMRKERRWCRSSSIKNREMVLLDQPNTFYFGHFHTSGGEGVLTRGSLKGEYDQV